MKRLAWVHENCLFAQENNRQVWAFLDSLGDRWDFGPLVKTAAVGDVLVYDIVLIRNSQIGESKDTRPALVTRIMGNGLFEVSPITGQFGLSANNSNPGDFPLLPDHSDFGTTSLRKPSVIKDRPLTVKSTDVMRIGHLSGGQLAEFLDHTGMPPAPKRQQVAPPAPPRPYAGPTQPKPKPLPSAPKALPQEAIK